MWWNSTTSGSYPEGAVQLGHPQPSGFIAQLAEHKTENLGVVGSIPTEATICFYSLMDRMFGYELKDMGSISVKSTNYFMGS